MQIPAPSSEPARPLGVYLQALLDEIRGGACADPSVAAAIRRLEPLPDEWVQLRRTGSELAGRVTADVDAVPDVTDEAAPERVALVLALSAQTLHQLAHLAFVARPGGRHAFRAHVGEFRRAHERLARVRGALSALPDADDWIELRRRVEVLESLLHKGLVADTSDPGRRPQPHPILPPRARTPERSIAAPAEPLVVVTPSVDWPPPSVQGGAVRPTDVRPAVALAGLLAVLVSGGLWVQGSWDQVSVDPRAASSYRAYAPVAEIRRASDRAEVVLDDTFQGLGPPERRARLTRLVGALNEEHGGYRQVEFRVGTDLVARWRRPEPHDIVSAGLQIIGQDPPRPPSVPVRTGGS